MGGGSCTWETPARCGCPHTYARPALLRDLTECLTVKFQGHPKTAAPRPSAPCLTVTTPFKKDGEKEWVPTTLSGPVLVIMKNNFVLTTLVNKRGTGRPTGSPQHVPCPRVAMLLGCWCACKQAPLPTLTLSLPTPHSLFHLQFLLSVFFSFSLHFCPFLFLSPFRPTLSCSNKEIDCQPPLHPHPTALSWRH